MASTQSDVLTSADWEEVRDVTRTLHEVSWFVVRTTPPFQWGCYVVACRRRATGELLLEEGRLELTTVAAQPDLQRALYGGPGCLYFGPPLRIHPTRRSADAA
jgi:hypothetical protein